MSTPAVLDLSAPVADRPSVIFTTAAHPDGEHFELRGELDLGIVTIIKIQTLFQKAAETQEGGIQTLAEAEQMERWIGECFDAMFHRPVDAETRASIPDLRKMQVIQFFLDACLTPASERAKPTPTPKSRAKSSTGAR